MLGLLVELGVFARSDYLVVLVERFGRLRAIDAELGGSFLHGVRLREQTLLDAGVVLLF